MSTEYANAKQLEARVNALIAEAKTIDGVNFGPVNWGDIGVVDIVEQRSLLDSDFRYVVVKIEEADPSCHLATWLTEQIDDSGVHVEAEW